MLAYREGRGGEEDSLVGFLCFCLERIQLVRLDSIEPDEVDWWIDDWILWDFLIFLGSFGIF